ncbi:hypothetical protein [Duganella violaceipulchra]|uniref:Uncharacterized protein n=1 Tax=Duganella violaceipulchra TaxID=2849652 RepID=A0AA41L2Z2_9BURK|nr:hypothetical protein [Duganella violaceicalia]MBV6323278.1 hypothetical protein [Duganella violaceicalia]MCP2007772.1 hypothetical protein [Duganella violaceicalia]
MKPNLQSASKVRELAWLGTALSLLATGHLYAAEEKASFYGHWRTVAVLDTADIAGMSDAEARKLVGLCVDVEPEVFKFAGEECAAPTYEQTTREPVRYLREQWHARAGKLHLPNPVKVVDAGCTDLFMLNQSRMVFNWNGFFFESRRVEQSQCPALLRGR